MKQKQSAGEPATSTGTMEPRGPIPRWEWAIAALGLLLMIGVLGYVGYHAAVGDQSPPDITLSLDSVIQQRHGYLAIITANNDGGLTASGVTIVGEMPGDDRCEVTLDNIPAKSSREVGLFFQNDPRQHPPVLRALGFTGP